MGFYNYPKGIGVIVLTKQELQTLLGKNLRKARFAQNLTIEEVAGQVGISTTFYSNLECGNKLMSLTTLRKLMEVLGVSADSLLLDNMLNENIRNIEMLLYDQPPENVAFIEKLIRLCISNFPNERKVKEESGQNECRTEQGDYTAVS